MINAPPNPHPARAALRSAVGRLYRLFAHRRRSSRPWADMDFPDDQLDLPERVTVEHLPGQAYAHLAWHALCFDGDHPDTVRYFLPRLLDEFSQGASAHGICPAMLVSYMNRCGWRGWAADEVDAIEQFFTIWLRDALSQPEWSGGAQASELVQSIAFAGIPLEQAWNVWRSDPTLTATLHLAGVIESTITTGRRSYLDGWRCTWGSEGPSESALTEVWRFLTSAETCARLEAGFFETDDAREQWQLSAALSTAEALRSSPP